MNDEDETEKVQTTETTFAIVDAIAELEASTLSAISTHLDISPSTVHRHLNTLAGHGYVTQTDGRFYVGSKFLTMGGEVRKQRQEYKWAEDYVRNLAEETNERAQFEIQDNGERVFLFRRVGTNTIREKSPIGKRGEMHSSAAGKAILAELPDERVEEIIEHHGLRAVTENTITDVDELFAELAEVRERGYATNFEESRIGYNAVGVSVTDANDEVLGALSVSGPSYRLDEEKITSETWQVVQNVVQEYELYIEFNTNE